MDLNKLLVFDPYSNPASVAQWNLWIRSFERYIVTANIKDNTRKQALFFKLAGEKLVQTFKIVI